MTDFKSSLESLAFVMGPEMAEEELFDGIKWGIFLDDAGLGRGGRCPAELDPPDVSKGLAGFQWVEMEGYCDGRNKDEDHHVVVEPDQFPAHHLLQYHKLIYGYKHETRGVNFKKFRNSRSVGRSDLLFSRISSCTVHFWVWSGSNFICSIR